MTNPPIESQITFLYTADLAKTAAFYEEVMRLEMVLDQGVCRIYRVHPNSFIGFCERAAPPADCSNVIFTLVTPDVNGWHAALAARGVIFEKPPQENPKFKIYHCFLRDPNGYLIEIQTFLDPRWREA